MASGPPSPDTHLGQRGEAQGVAGSRAVSVLRACISVVLLVAMAASPALAGSSDVEPSATPSPIPGSLPERVLFIGNSHTERHGGMDWLISNFVAAEDTPRVFEADRRTASGVTLEYHFRNGAPERIRKGDWDVVVLQEYLPASPTRTAEPFLDYARRLDELIRDAGARTVFYMTWPQGRFDWADLDDFVAAHRQVEAELGAKVAPVGVAMERARAERPDLVLLDEDEVHASWEGAYLAAAVIYATLFDRSPEGLAYTFGVSEDDAAFLQHIAWQTVVDWQAGEPSAP
jgi:hypothetical protein